MIKNHLVTAKTQVLVIRNPLQLTDVIYNYLVELIIEPNDPLYVDFNVSYDFFPGFLCS